MCITWLIYLCINNTIPKLLIILLCDMFLYNIPLFLAEFIIFVNILLFITILKTCVKIHIKNMHINILLINK